MISLIRYLLFAFDTFESLLLLPAWFFGTGILEAGWGADFWLEAFPVMASAMTWFSKSESDELHELEQDEAEIT